ncbi:cardiolipin synthase [Corynebacterium aquilae]|uniref:Cardiolipin synthase n=1 Tax=Corynebacterium aquilae DSM 44791 TaxID=1431546 RepID=A0A1L7CI47_9CORY|nr:cardiolipin synthase [Corynebacterium aquilae]APT85524.1 cardiolipin synthase [Corynebacterium aquilae DSM 44791]
MSDFLSNVWSNTDIRVVGLIIDYTIKAIAIGFVPEGRRPSSSMAWLLAIMLIPVLGLPLYLLMGSAYINRRRHRIQEEAAELISGAQANQPDCPDNAELSPELRSIIRMNRKLTGFPAFTGTALGFHHDYVQSFRAMAEAIDKARDYVHIEIYIVAWDHTTDVVFQAMARAVDRGVKVRLLIDQVGSWKYPGYVRLGKRLDAIGVDWHLMLPLAPWRWRFRRPDLRNHRKMVIVDGEVGFIGSQNLIDSTYLSKKNMQEGRHWIDVMVELTGPVVTSMNTVFAVDWYQESDEIITEFRDLENPQLPAKGEENPDHINVFQLVPSGPGYDTEPNLRMFNQAVHHAKKHLVICSPYFIPDESLLEAVTSACYRDVRVDLLVNEVADQFMVGHAQSSYYAALLEAGVHIHLYPAPFILHTKFVVADPEGEDPIGIVGSSNLDMRSFGLNYETSLFTARGNVTDSLWELGQGYMASSRELTLDQWEKRPLRRRYIDNVMRLTSALQ